MSYTWSVFVIANPRFKASLRLTEPRTASAVTKSGAYHCPGTHAVRMFLDMEVHIPPYIYVCVYIIYLCICVCIYILCQRQKSTKLRPDEKKGQKHMVNCS